MEATCVSLRTVVATTMVPILAAVQRDTLSTRMVTAAMVKLLLDMKLVRKLNFYEYIGIEYSIIYNRLAT